LANSPKKSSKKSSSTAKSSSSATKVTRIKAEGSAPVKQKSAAKAATETKPSKEASEKSGRNPLRAIGGYFAGAWYELRQVHWPNRRATWNMTLALIAFTAFFVVIILLLDSLFQYLFNLILG